MLYYLKATPSKQSTASQFRISTLSRTYRMLWISYGGENIYIKYMCLCTDTQLLNIHEEMTTTHYSVLILDTHGVK